MTKRPMPSRKVFMGSSHFILSEAQDLAACELRARAARSCVASRRRIKSDEFSTKHTRHSRTHTRENFVRDCIGARGDLVGGDAVAEERDFVAERGAVDVG